jgi:CHRD domain
VQRITTILFTGLVVLTLGAGAAWATSSGYLQSEGGTSTSGLAGNATKVPPQTGYATPIGKFRSVAVLKASKVAQSAYLTGTQEVDADGPEAGDPDAKGTATFLSVNETTLCYGFTLRGAATPTEVHVHKGAIGTNGPVVLAFANVPKNAAGAPSGDPGASAGCKTAANTSEQQAMARIRRHPERYYVNMHTAAFPDGAVRGQLSRLVFAGS